MCFSSTIRGARRAIKHRKTNERGNGGGRGERNEQSIMEIGKGLCISLITSPYGVLCLTYPRGTY